MSRRISEDGVALIKGHEELRLLAYDDARPDHILQPGDHIVGTLTIGYGHTADVKIGDALKDEAQADALLREDLKPYERAVDQMAGAVPLNNNEFAALVSFAFNVGPTKMRTATFFKEIKAGMSRRSAIEKITWWNKTRKDGVLVFSRGLHKRRCAERDLFNKPVAQSG